MRGGGYKEGPPEWHAHGGPDAHEFGGSAGFSWQLTRLAPLKVLRRVMVV